MTRLTISSCSHPIVIDSSQISIDSCIFEANTGSVMSIGNSATVTDSNSIYRSTIISNANGWSAIYLASSSTYTGTNIEMSSNQSVKSGGGVIVTGFSTYICNTCRYLNNKTQLSGGVFFSD